MKNTDLYYLERVKNVIKPTCVRWHSSALSSKSQQTREKLNMTASCPLFLALCSPVAWNGLLKSWGNCLETIPSWNSVQWITPGCSAGKIKIFPDKGSVCLCVQQLLLQFSINLIKARGGNARRSQSREVPIHDPCGSFGSQMEAEALGRGSLCLCTFLISWDLSPVLMNKQMKLVQQTHLLIYLFKDMYFTVMPWRQHHTGLFSAWKESIHVCVSWGDITQLRTSQLGLGSLVCSSRWSKAQCS